MFVGNVDFEVILISRIVRRFDCEVVLSLLPAIQEKLNLSRFMQLLRFVIVACPGAFDGGDRNAVGIRTDDGHFVWQHIPCQLVVVYGVCGLRFPILAENHRLGAVEKRITHLQRHVIPEVQNDLIMVILTVGDHVHRDSIRIGGLALRHFHGQRINGIPQISVVRVRCIADAPDSRIGRVFARQFQLVGQSAAGKLIILYFSRDGSLRLTGLQFMPRSAAFHPRKGKLHIRELLIGNLIPEKHIPFRSPDRK